LLQLAWRQNRALDRWLDYLLSQGHSLATMSPETLNGHAKALKTPRSLVEKSV
jgi:hypothetical protein